MKYIYKFKKIGYGSVTIEAETEPSKYDVINAIKKEEIYFGLAEHYEITLNHVIGTTLIRLCEIDGISQ